MHTSNQYLNAILPLLACKAKDVWKEIQQP